MSQTLTSAQVCALLTVDAWGLRRLIALGDLAPIDGVGEPGFAEDAVLALKALRQRRRTDALTDLAAMDGPHMGLGQ